MPFYCQRCGTGLPPSARFCSNCGNVVTAAPPPPGRPLVRPIVGRQIAGVCIGVAQANGWDVTLVRILTVVGCLFTSGLVGVAYLAGWIGIPEEPVAMPGAYRRGRRELSSRRPLSAERAGRLSSKGMSKTYDSHGAHLSYRGNRLRRADHLSSSHSARSRLLASDDQRSSARCARLCRIFVGMEHRSWDRSAGGRFLACSGRAGIDHRATGGRCIGADGSSGTGGGGVRGLLDRRLRDAGTLAQGCRCGCAGWCLSARSRSRMLKRISRNAWRRLPRCVARERQACLMETRRR